MISGFYQGVFVCVGFEQKSKTPVIVPKSAIMSPETPLLKHQKQDFTLSAVRFASLR